MTTITAKFTGAPTNLNVFKETGIKYATNKFVGVANPNTLRVTWVCENDEKALEECMECVNMRELEIWGIELNYITEA